MRTIEIVNREVANWLLLLSAFASAAFPLGNILDMEVPEMLHKVVSPREPILCLSWTAPSGTSKLFHVLLMMNSRHMPHQICMSLKPLPLSALELFAFPFSVRLIVSLWPGR